MHPKDTTLAGHIGSDFVAIVSILIVAIDSCVKITSSKPIDLHTPCANSIESQGLPLRFVIGCSVSVCGTIAVKFSPTGAKDDVPADGRGTRPYAVDDVILVLRRGDVILVCSISCCVGIADGSRCRGDACPIPSYSSLRTLVQHPVYEYLPDEPARYVSPNRVAHAPAVVQDTQPLWNSHARQCSASISTQSRCSAPAVVFG